MRWWWLFVLVAAGACDRKTQEARPAGPSTAAPPPSEPVAGARSVHGVKTTVRRYSGGGTHWDIDGAIHLAPTSLEVDVEGLVEPLDAAARRGLCTGWELPGMRCGEPGEVTLQLVVEEREGVVVASLDGRPRVRRYGVRPTAGVVHAVPWHAVKVEARAAPVADAVGAAALGQALRARWEAAVREALKSDARPMGEAVAKTVVRDEAAAQRVAGGSEHPGRPVWVAGGKVWGMFSAGTTHLVHVLDFEGPSAVAIFDGLSERGRHGDAFASLDETRGRLLYAVDYWLPWRPSGGRPSRPRSACDRPTCRGITVVGVDGEGALHRVGRIDDHALVSNAGVGPGGTIYAVGRRGEEASLLRLDEEGQGVALPRARERDWAYRVHVRPQDVVVESPAGLWAVEAGLGGRPTAIHRFEPPRNAAAVGADVAFVGPRAVVVHEREAGEHVLRRLPGGGSTWRVAIQTSVPWMRMGVAGRFVFVAGVGLFSLEDGSRVGAEDALDGVEPSFAEIDGTLVGCTKAGVARWSSTGTPEAEVVLPWRCRAVGPGPRGGVIVATSYPIGAYLLGSPSHW